MFRIDGTAAAVALPTPAALGTPGYFTEGNPGTGTPATVVSADWLNAIQEELLTILSAAGISPNKAVQNQLLAALQSISGAGGSASVASISSGPYAALRGTKTIVVDTTSGNVEVDLPAAATCTGETWHIVKKSSDVNVVNVKPNGTETINGASLQTCDGPWTVLGFRSIGTGFILV